MTRSTAAKPPIGPVSPIGMKALSSSRDEPRPHPKWAHLGVKHPGTGEPSAIGVRDILMFSMLINLLLLLLLLLLLHLRRNEAPVVAIA